MSFRRSPYQTEEKFRRKVYNWDHPAQDQSRNQAAQRELIGQDALLQIGENHAHQQSRQKAELERHQRGPQRGYENEEQDRRQRFDDRIARRNRLAAMAAAPL